MRTLISETKSIIEKMLEDRRESTIFFFSSRAQDYSYEYAYIFLFCKYTISDPQPFVYQRAVLKKIFVDLMSPQKNVQFVGLESV